MLQTGKQRGVVRPFVNRVDAVAREHDSLQAMRLIVSLRKSATMGKAYLGKSANAEYTTDHCCRRFPSKLISCNAEIIATLLVFVSAVVERLCNLLYPDSTRVREGIQRARRLNSIHVVRVEFICNSLILENAARNDGVFDGKLSRF